jgi:hypothetical protein
VSTALDVWAPEIAHLRDDLAQIEEKVTTNFTLADAIREGSGVSEQAHNWGKAGEACALSAAFISAKARGYAA